MPTYSCERCGLKTESDLSLAPNRDQVTVHLGCGLFVKDLEPELELLEERFNAGL